MIADGWLGALLLACLPCGTLVMVALYVGLGIYGAWLNYYRRGDADLRTRPW